MLDIKKLQESGVQVFGAPLYKESQVFGTVAPGEYELQAEYNSVKIDLGDGTFISARLRQARIDAGLDAEKDTLTIAEFVAMRDASGKNADGSPWTVKAGDKRTFAY